MFTGEISYLSILVLLFSCVWAQYRFGCEKEFCTKKVNCPPVNCKNGGRLIENATVCGCCHICVQQLALGDLCDTQPPSSSIPDKECGPGLVCDKIKTSKGTRESTCVHAKTKCIQDRLKFDEEFKNEKLRFGKTRPECDEYGFYKPIVCISDVLCYCVDKYGERIFGTNIAANKNTMDCNCSRDFEGFPKTKRVDNFLRCLPNGNYDELQCTEEWCYCMQASGQGPGFAEKAGTSLKSLQCYDKTRHNEYDSLLRSKCLQKRYKLQQEIKSYEDQNIKVVDLELPHCDLDGSYAPVQCKKDKCYCVKKDGKVYEGFNIPRKDAKDMTCRCLRETEMLNKVKYPNKNTEVFGKFKCSQNGNYMETQTIDASVISVSDMGYQIHEIF